MNSHEYTDGPNLVCAAELECTADEMRDQLSRFGYPGQDPSNPAISGNRYWVSALGIPGGIVTTFVSSDGLTVSNVTSFLHVFCCGDITRTAFQGDGGAWYVTTSGSGTNLIPFMGFLNQVTGPSLFYDLDMQMRNNILLHHSTQ
jgi:hypothetical protein